MKHAPKPDRDPPPKPLFQINTDRVALISFALALLGGTALIAFAIVLLGVALWRAF
jgi:hypothetical protein